MRERARSARERSRRGQVLEIAGDDRGPTPARALRMLALQSGQRPPPVEVAHYIMARVFGAPAVRNIGTIFTQFEARGSFRALKVRVVLEMSNTRRSTKPFTTIDIEEDFDVSVYTGGARWPYESWEPFAPFSSARLAGRAMAGAPRALVTTIARGPIGERLAATGIESLAIGADAKRDDCATRGVRLVVHGWPQDEVARRYLIDTAIEIALETRLELSVACWSRGARHPEVVAYEMHRASSRARGLKVVAAVFAGLSAVTALVIALLVGLR